MKKINSIFFIWVRQFAWLYIKNNHQRLNVEHLNNNYELIHNHSKFINRSQLYDKENFYQWLVGFTDGDGSFTIYRQISKIGQSNWSLFYKINQSNYNLRVLYYIKKELGYGSVQIENNRNMADFRIRDKIVIKKVIFLIFDKYPLLTSKYFKYMKFKKAYDIITDSNISNEEKDELLLKLMDKTLPSNFISPAWQKVNNEIRNTNEAKVVMSKFWLIGFTEAEGSFYLVQKDASRLVHAFEITQKLDIIILYSIAHILDISVKNKKKYNTVVTTNLWAIFNIINYFKNTMKGMKALEYRIWSQSFKLYKGDYQKLNRTRDLIRKIRLIRFDKNCRVKD